MRVFWKYLKEFIKEDFHLLSYIYLAIFLAAAFTINYTLDFEDQYVDTVPDQYGIPAYLLFYVVAWFGVAIPSLLLRKEYGLLKKKEFWIAGFIILLILSIDAGFYHHRKWVKAIENIEDRALLRKLFVNIFSVCWYTFAFFIFRKIYFKTFPTNAFGILKPTSDWKAYLGLWMLMLPPLIWASFQDDFILQYPEFKPWVYIQLFNQNPWIFSPLYELCYALDFVAVEWLFRGALVIGMAKILGRHALLPMVSCYAFLHFGKPFAEALGSIFGGYILGVIALRSGSIWGGCLVHVGIALTMDALAISQYWRNEMSD